MDDSNKTTPAKMPLWVLLAFSSIHKRKHAILLIWVCIIFTIYCLPWKTFISSAMVAKIFVIEDWSWAAMMLPICLWYILCLRWMDKNTAWP
jgi:hypothetical protein